MEQKNLPTNVMTLGGRSLAAAASAGYSVRSQVAALDATIAYCQSRREGYGQKARALQALCAELQLRKTRPN